jgi:hypothetical protein
MDLVGVRMIVYKGGIRGVRRLYHLLYVYEIEN